MYSATESSSGLSSAFEGFSMHEVRLKKSEKDPVLNKIQTELVDSKRLNEEQKQKIKELHTANTLLKVDLKMAEEQRELIQALYESSLKDLVKYKEISRANPSDDFYTPQQWEVLQNQLKCTQHERNENALKLAHEKEINKEYKNKIVNKNKKIDLLKFCLKQARQELQESQKRLHLPFSNEERLHTFSSMTTSPKNEEEDVFVINLDNPPVAIQEKRSKRLDLLVSSSIIPYYRTNVD